MANNNGFLPLDSNYATRAIHDAQSPSQWKSRAVVPPITLTSTFELDGFDFSKGYTYGRWGNPSREILEKSIASLEKAKYGLCYPSGLAAVAAAMDLLTAGDHVLCASDVYGGTHHQIAECATKHGLEVNFFDVADVETIDKQFKSNTKMVWFESPSNPLGKIVDIQRLANICHKKSNIMLGIDNTYLSSYFQKPLDLGVDIVMYSMTKYMNGHADVIMGSLVLNDDKIYQRLLFNQNYLGSVPSPFDCYLVNRGLKTMAIRMRQHNINGIHVAKYLKTHPLVKKVIYPGLPDHPQHELLKKQASGYSGMIAFYMKSGGLKEGLKFLKALKCFKNAASLGGVESLACVPATLSHFKTPLEERIKIGITDNLIRLSVGIEDPEDLTKDLDQALRDAFL